MNNFLTRFFTQNNFIHSSCEIIGSGELSRFRCSLLNTILLTASFLSFFVVLLSIMHIFPLNTSYQYVLFGYSFLTLLTYFFLQKNHTLYFIAVNILIISSLLTFTMMTSTIVHDEFRLVWFFLTSFASFILGGRLYGIIITILIVLIISFFHIYSNLYLSNYAIFTFVAALITFNIFSLFFLNKIEKDSQKLQERIAAEVTKQQEQEQILLHQYRMTNMGEMIDAIAHQWRQPLTQINMTLLSMEDELENSTTNLSMNKKIEELYTLTSHMSQTIDDFRNLLHKDKNKNTFMIDDVLTDVLNLLKNSIKDITIIKNIYPDTELTGYKNELIQVFIILLSNAIEALNSNMISNKKIFITVKETDQHVDIVIEDNADGLDDTIISKLFDPYFTTKKKLSGSGLGLYIAKIIIEDNMKGKISVSKGQYGAKFKLEVKKEL